MTSNNSKATQEALTSAYNFLVNSGYNIASLSVYGSQNYGLDVYTEDYTSDVDLPNEPIVNLSKTLYDAGYTILACSGREWTDQCRADTLQWIKRQGIPMTSLFMREEWDKRPDTEVKREMLYNEILPNYYIEWVFDDRNRVVQMWREEGLTCLQVAEWNF